MRFQLTIKGFRCYKENEIIFNFDSSFVLIEGPSGSGKSTILQSIYWVCYGSLTSIYSHNSTTKDPCYVQLKMISGNSNSESIMGGEVPPCCKRGQRPIAAITIYRQKRPELLRLTLGNISYEGSVAQSIINSKFGNKDNWIAGSYLSQGSRCSLLTSSNNEKMAILNSLAFSSSDDHYTPENVISSINERLSTLTIKFDILQNQYKESVDIYNHQIKEYGSEISSFIEPEKIEKEIVITEKRLQSLINQYHKISTLQAKYDHIQSSISQIPSNDLSIELLESQLINCEDKILYLRSSQERWWRLSKLKDLNDKFISMVPPPIVAKYQDTTKENQRVTQQSSKKLLFLECSTEPQSIDSILYCLIEKLTSDLTDIEEKINRYKSYLHYENDFKQYTRLKTKINSKGSVVTSSKKIELIDSITSITDKVKNYQSISLYWNSYLRLKKLEEDFKQYSQQQYEKHISTIEMDKRSFPLLNKFKKLKDLENKYSIITKNIDQNHDLNTVTREINLLKQWSGYWRSIKSLFSIEITRDNIKTFISDLNIIIQILPLIEENKNFDCDEGELRGSTIYSQQLESLISQRDDLIKTSELLHNQITEMEFYEKQSKETLICPHCSTHLKLINGVKLVIQDQWHPKGATVSRTSQREGARQNQIEQKRDNSSFSFDYIKQTISNDDSTNRISEILKGKRSLYYKDQNKIKSIQIEIEKCKKRKENHDKLLLLQSQLKIISEIGSDHSFLAKRSKISFLFQNISEITKSIGTLSTIDFDLIKTIKVDNLNNFDSEIKRLIEIIEVININKEIDLLKLEIPEQVQQYILTVATLRVEQEPFDCSKHSEKINLSYIESYKEREIYIDKYQNIKRNINELKQSIPENIFNRLDSLSFEGFDLIELLKKEEKILKQYQDDLVDMNNLEEIKERMGMEVLNVFEENKINLPISIKNLKVEEMKIKSELDDLTTFIKERRRLEKEIKNLLISLNVENKDISIESVYDGLKYFSSLTQILLNELKIDLPLELADQEKNKIYLEDCLNKAKERKRLIIEKDLIKEQLNKYTSEIDTSEIDTSDQITSLTDTITSLNQNLNRLRIKLDSSRRTQTKIQQLNDKRIILEKLYNEVIQINTYIAACQRLKTIAIETEYHNLQVVVDNLNYSLKTVLDSIFDDPITVHLHLFKALKSDKGRIKPQVNIKIMYRGGEYDNINQLSGGEGDRISLAMTVALSKINNSPFLMLDESLSSLDAELKDKCLNSLRSLLEDTEKTVICINHDSMTGSYDQIIQMG